MSKKLLSIVVPTINRYETLQPLVLALMDWKSADFEVIIHDNSTDNSSFLSFLSRHADERVRYFHHQGYLSAVANCDLALSKAAGEFVCFIGDDDGLAPQIMELCAWMAANKVESAYCNIALYTWPDSEHAVAINNKYNGKLITPDFNRQIKTLDVESEYTKVIRAGGQAMYHVPRVYQGIVAKACLDKVFAQVGTYFPGPVPDMSNAMALAGKVGRHCFVDAPLIISGHSKKSMSGKNSRREHQGEIKKEKSLPPDTIENWHKQVPFFWSAPTIWAQACLEATRKVHREGQLQRFNFAKLYAYCLVFCNRSYYSRIFKAMGTDRSFIRMIPLLAGMSAHVVGIMWLRGVNFLNKKLKGIQGYDCRDIIAAMNQTDSALQERRLAFSK